MKPDPLGDQLEQFRRWLIRRHWRDTVVRVVLLAVLIQIAFLFFGLGLWALVWVLRPSIDGLPHAMDRVAEL
jgi:hypothetical protein